MPVEPPPTVWRFPDPARDDGTREGPRNAASTSEPDDLVALGGDLAPGTLLAAYRHGIFPMPAPEIGPGTVAWFSPDPRAVIPVPTFRPSRSLRASRRRFVVRVNEDFEQTVRRCADPRRPHGWINDDVLAAYCQLHELGWAYSVESWTHDGDLAGGLYGVQVGGLFAGESMWHHDEPWGRDASKVALAWLVEAMVDAGDAPHRLLDVQWRTPHLARLGAVEVPRAVYRERLRAALTLAPALVDKP
jgi:leucyl/phenylalanyl-tRNA--protein transferase